MPSNEIILIRQRTALREAHQDLTALAEALGIAPPAAPTVEPSLRAMYELQQLEAVSQTVKDVRGKLREFHGIGAPVDPLPD